MLSKSISFTLPILEPFADGKPHTKNLISKKVASSTSAASLDMDSSRDVFQAFPSVIFVKSVFVK